MTVLAQIHEQPFRNRVYITPRCTEDQFDDWVARHPGWSYTPASRKDATVHLDYCPKHYTGLKNDGLKVDAQLCSPSMGALLTLLVSQKRKAPRCKDCPIERK